MSRIPRSIVNAAGGLGLFLLSACGPPASSESEIAADEAVREGVLMRLDEVRAEPMSALYSTSATLRAFQRATVTARTQEWCAS